MKGFSLRVFPVLFALVLPCFERPAGAQEVLSPGDQQILQAVGQALATCSIAPGSVPAPWRIVPVGGHGCSVSVPPGWVVTNANEMFSAMPDLSQTVGYAYFSANLPGTTWTVQMAGLALLNQLRMDTPSMVPVQATTDQSYAALGITIRTLVVRFTRATLEEVGSIRLVFMGCSELLGSCQYLATMSWAPVDQLDQYACILAQIDATVVCPEPDREDEQED